jgi:outer membrane protein assembly factor BamB
MTDKELIALVESKLPQEMSLEELELIQRRLQESPAVREALAGQLELNEYLATVISPVELSADEVFARAGRSDHFRRRGVWALLGWTVCLLMVAFVVSMLALPFLRPLERDRNAQLAEGQSDANKADPTEPSAAGALDASGPPKSNSADSHSGPGSAKNPDGKTPGKHGEGEAASPDGSKHPAQAKVDSPPQFPWQRKEQLSGPPRPWDQVALETVGTTVAQGPNAAAGFPGSAPGMADTKQWFTTTQGDWQIQPRDWQGHRLPFYDGLVRFRGPWSEDSVLRLSLVDCVPFAIHFWKDQTGLSLRLYNNRWSLTAYRTHRDGDIPTRRLPVPKNFVTLATDEMRNWNSTAGTFPLRFDLRFHGGEFIVSRGDLVLLRAPFEGLPTETYFEGHTMFAGLDMVRVVGESPAEPDPLPALKDITRPADLAWHGNAAVQGIAFTKLADGSVEMKSNGAKATGAQWFDLPQQGLYEIEMELDHVTPGSRVVFGGAATDPIASVAFMNENQTHGMSCKLVYLSDQTQLFDQIVANDPCRFTAPHQWIKLVGGCGLTRLYGGVDGIHWARFEVGVKDIWTPPLLHLGLACTAGDGVHSIMLRRVVLREFHELAQLAPAELLAKAPSLTGGSLQEWQAAVAKQPMPPGASPAAWQRACALRTVIGNSPDTLGRQLLAGLFGYSLNTPMTVERRLRLLHEIATVSDVWSDGNDATNLVTRFELLGDQFVRQQYATPWSAVDGAVLRAPIWAQANYSTKLESLARAELLQLVYSNQPDQVLRTVARLRLSNCSDPLMLWAEDWASTQSGTALGGDVVAEHTGRNPLIDELNKEGFSTLAEFESALDSQSYHDACQIITSPATLEITGLMPDPRDPQLSVSLETAVGAALRHDAALREMMTRQFGPAGMLEVRRSMGQSDADAVLAAATRYRGTEAAAEACLWLGDRAVGGGDFNRARVWYRQAKQNGNAALAKRIAPRDRLAAAMLGEDVGSPATEPVQFGVVTMPAGEFESLVADMRKTHAPTGLPHIGAIVAAPLVPAAPAPGGFELQQLERFDGDMGDNPGEVNNPTPSRGNSLRWLRPIAAAGLGNSVDSPLINTGLDWAGRQLAAAADSDRLYVSNRFQVSAFELKSGHRVWRTELGGDHDRTHDWTLVPMRPLPVGSRIFVRRLTRTHPELAALETASGTVKWRSSPTLTVVSDPIWLGDEVAAISAARVEQQTVFSLTVFDPADGSIRRTQPIATMQESWWSQRTCQLTQAGDDLIVVLCGAVVCCDVSGKSRWTRRQEWLSPTEDHDWGRQSQIPPLVAGAKLLVTQPGVAAVECIDLHGGSLLWRTAMPGIHRAIGVVGDRLIAETDYGIAALSIEKGELVWYHPAVDLLEGQLCGGPGQLVYSCRQQAPGNPNQMRPVLVWLNVANGAEISRHALDALRQDHPMFGPFAAVGDRLWVFAAGTENEPTRTLYELRPHGPAVANDTPSAPASTPPVPVASSITPAEADLRGEKPPQNGIWLETLDLSKLKQGWGEVHAGHTVDGGPITLGGMVYRHGVGTHSASDVSIDLKGSAVRFVAVVGVDDDRRGLGSVHFHVFVDGNPPIDTPIMRGGDHIQFLSVDLTGAKQLRLSVDDAGDGIANDHADWAGAVLILKPDAKERPQTVDLPKSASSSSTARVHQCRIFG